MEYLQYWEPWMEWDYKEPSSFKPYYKWNTFNTIIDKDGSIVKDYGFKPYYKWNTFNTANTYLDEVKHCISFKPYYKWNTFNTEVENNMDDAICFFNNYYKWNTFNTEDKEILVKRLKRF